MNDRLGIVTTFIHNIVVYNIPLLYGTVGEILIEKSGSLNLGVEGIMAVGAIFGYIVGCYANSLLVGVLAASSLRPVRAAVCGAHRVSPGQPEHHRPDPHHFWPGRLLLRGQRPEGSELAGPWPTIPA